MTEKQTVEFMQLMRDIKALLVEIEANTSPS